MNPRRSALLAVAALLLVPLSSAQALDLDARRLDAEGVHLTAPAAVFYAAEAEGARMFLTAQSVRVVEHAETRDFSDAYVDLSNRPGVRDDTRDHQGVQWTGEIFDPHGHIFLTASAREAGMSLSTSAMRAGLPPADRESVTPPPRTGDPNEYQPLVAGMALVRAGAVEAEFHGDFTVRLWGGHLGGPTSDGSAAYEAGHSREAQKPFPENPVTVQTRDVFITVHVQNGTFAVSTPPSAAVRTYLDGPARIEGDRARLHGAIGTSAGSPVDGTLTLDDFSLLASAVGDGLHLRTPPSEPAPTGLTSALPEPSVSVPLLVLLLCAVGGLALFVRSRRPTSVQMLLNRMEQKQYRSVVRHAGPVLRRTQSEAVSVMKAVALLALGQASRALRFLETLPPELRPADGMDPFLRAHALNELGEPDEARRFLKAALGENPGLAVELSGLPRLRALIPDEAPPGAYA